MTYFSIAKTGSPVRKCSNFISDLLRKVLKCCCVSCSFLVSVRFPWWSCPSIIAFFLHILHALRASTRKTYLQRRGLKFRIKRLFWRSWRGAVSDALGNSSCMRQYSLELQTRLKMLWVSVHSDGTRNLCVFYKENLEDFKRSVQKWESHVTQCTVPLQHRRLMRSGFQYITWTKSSEVIIIAVEANPRVPIHLSRIPFYFPLFCTHPFHTSLPPWMHVTQAGDGSDIMQMLRSLCAKASMKGREKCPTKHPFSTQGWTPQRINSHHNSSSLKP